MTDFKRYLLDEFVEDYEEGRLSRREALRLIAGVTGSLALASTILAACAPAATSPATSTAADAATLQGRAQAADTPAPTPEPTSAQAQPAEAPTLEAEQGASGELQAGGVEFPGEGATLIGYLAHPAADEPSPAVLVCHENRGLTDHIKDVTRRVAMAGYVGLAVDLLSRQGGTASVGDSSQVPGILGNMPPDQFVQDFISGWRWLQSQPYVQADRVGMVGFCFGGGVTWRVAIGLPELRAAVPFYGPHPSVDEVASIQAAVLAIYAERDQRITGGAAAVEAAMQQSGKVYEKVIYPNADHAFHNDTGTRYNPEAARDAWARTLAWFDRYLRSA
jgi:carboxymethylenebutenolidase